MPIPDEKARAWTRPEDYWPPRRPSRATRTRRQWTATPTGGADPLHEPRPTLGVVPYLLLMLSLMVMSAAIIVIAWPGSTPPPREQVAVQSEPGTAPKGWMTGS